jgi:hypothetical protein
LHRKVHRHAIAAAWNEVARWAKTHSSKAKKKPKYSNVGEAVGRSEVDHRCGDGPYHKKIILAIFFLPQVGDLIWRSSSTLSKLPSILSTSRSRNDIDKQVCRSANISCRRAR